MREYLEASRRLRMLSMPSRGQSVCFSYGLRHEPDILDALYHSREGQLVTSESGGFPRRASYKERAEANPALRSQQGILRILEDDLSGRMALRDGMDTTVETS